MTNSLVKKMGEDEIKSLFGEHQNDETNIISTLLKMKELSVSLTPDEIKLFTVINELKLEKQIYINMKFHRDTESTDGLLH